MMTAPHGYEVRVVFAFDNRPSAPWFPADDTVMGGHSQSALVFNPGTAHFGGVVSFENNGGFCSVRSPDLPEGLSGYRGISLRVRGDGKTYTLCLHTRALMPGTSYRCRFTTSPEGWTDLVLPFEQFILMRFGHRVGVEPVNPQQVRGLSLMIADRQEGAFSLEIAQVGVYR